MSCILDFVRASITFKSVKALINGVKEFCKLVNNGKIRCISSIVRVKNGFKEIETWNDLSEFGYRDLKINILITNDNIAVCGELQFLLDWMLHAKKMLRFIRLRANIGDRIE